jgi:two-component system, cell cycle sensor histidine kinase and response regulator CckA
MNMSHCTLKGEDVLRCLLNASLEGFLVLDPQGKFFECNEIFCQLTGYSHEFLLEHRLFDILDEEYTETFQEEWGRILGGTRNETTCQLRSPSHRLIKLQMNFLNHQMEEGHFVCVFCKEITSFIEDQQLMKLQNQALAATANAVVITDAKGSIVWVNRAFSKYTGYALDEAVGGQPGTLLKSGKHDAAFYRDMWETIRRGDIWQGEIINRRKDGSFYPEEMTITPMFNSLGEITHYIAIKQDVSEKKNLQEMFLRAQRLESLGTLASGIAHDLNNVLAPIVMSADLLMVQIDDFHTREMLQMIKGSAKRGADIIRQLLTFVRGDAEEMIELQIRHLLKEMIKIYRETFPRYITIEDRISPNLKPVMGDATRLHQVFTNLMINARDAMPEGGNLLIRAENVSISPAEAKANPQLIPGEFVRVRIKDEGTGIPAEMQEKIFSTFFTTKAQGQGTGLGLPTALGIMKKHHGLLLLESEVGKGSSFDVYIPVYAGEANLNNVWQEDVPYGNGEQLLVIDDEESIGFMLRGTLKSLNYDVKVTQGGEEGLEWWKRNRSHCDLILLDMMMPEMDGAAVFQALKKENCASEILVMSGMVSEEKLSQTEIDMETSFIAKPFTIMELAKKIHYLLDK